MRQSAFGSRELAQVGPEQVSETTGGIALDQNPEPVSVSSYRDLRVWQDAMQLAEDCYLLTKGLPREEMFGISAQIRKAAGSIPANIAEGYGREQTQSYIHFLRIAQGSLKELETHLLLTERVGLAKAESVAPLLTGCDGIGRMLRSLIRSLQSWRGKA